MYKRDEPCDSYFGNVCSGFGGSLICDFCGWDMFDHPDMEEDSPLDEGERSG